MATEVSPGTMVRPNKVFGWTFSGQTKGDSSGPIFMSVNYDEDITGISPVDSVTPMTLNLVSGGSWSEQIYVDGSFAGSISGSIVSGTVSWNTDRTVATVELQLICDNGTGTFAGASGSGTFTGTLDRASAGAVTGTLTLDY